MHLDDETTQRWLHGELDQDARHAVSAHLADCPPCRQQLTEAEEEEQWIRRRLESMDHPVPAVSPPRIPSTPRSSPWLRWAAAVLLTCAAAGAAYAVPGSPLPRWLGTVRGWLEPPAPAVPQPVAPPAVTSGIAVPLEPRLIIRFTTTQMAGVVRVTLVDSGMVAVRVRNGTATFATSPGLLLIDNQGSIADYEIDLPRGSRWVAIDVRDTRLLSKRDTLVRGVAPPDSAGGYTLPLTMAGGR